MEGIRSPLRLIGWTVHGILAVGCTIVKLGIASCYVVIWGVCRVWHDPKEAWRSIRRVLWGALCHPKEAWRNLRPILWVAMCDHKEAWRSLRHDFWGALCDPAGTCRNFHRDFVEIPIHRQRHLLYQQERVKRSIAVCTSAKEANVKFLITKLSGELDADVKYVNLPYNDIDDFLIDECEHDKVILCHSIHNRRLAITDVMDALYDKFLPTVASIFGKENVAVVAHDFPLESIENEDKYRMLIEAMKTRQPTAFKSASLVLVAGKLEDCVEMSPNGWSEIKKFVDGSGKVTLKPAIDI